MLFHLSFLWDGILSVSRLFSPINSLSFLTIWVGFNRKIHTAEIYQVLPACIQPVEVLHAVRSTWTRLQDAYAALSWLATKTLLSRMRCQRLQPRISLIFYPREYNRNSEAYRWPSEPVKHFNFVMNHYRICYWKFRLFFTKWFYNIFALLDRKKHNHQSCLYSHRLSIECAF